MEKDTINPPPTGHGQIHSNVLTYKRQHGEEVVDVLGGGGIINLSIELRLKEDRKMRDADESSPAMLPKGDSQKHTPAG